MKIICTGLNYATHIAEQGMKPPAEPLIFGKFPNTLIGPGEAIVLPFEATHVDSEAELAVEIDRSGRRIGEDDALDFVAGYRCANDISARNLQYGDKQWTRGKGFDTFCPLGDRLVPVAELCDGTGLRVMQRLNGELVPGRQHRGLRLGVRRLVAFASTVMTPEPGDLILTGTRRVSALARTPPVAMLHGDVVEIEVEGTASSCNPVVAERLRPQGRTSSTILQLCPGPVPH